jgi:hypothetical protein
VQQPRPNLSDTLHRFDQLCNYDAALLQVSNIGRRNWRKSFSRRLDCCTRSRGTGQRAGTRSWQLPAELFGHGRGYIPLAVSGGNAYPAEAYVPPGGVTPPAISKSYIAFALPAGGEKKKP